MSKASTLLCFFALSLTCGYIYAEGLAIKLDGLYQMGEVEALRSLLEQSEPTGAEEKSAKLYYQARISVDRDAMIGFLEELVTTFSHTTYGQKSILEISKLSLLERDYNRSLHFLSQGNNFDNPEIDFLLAKTYLKIGRYQDAIQAAQNYITKTKNREKRENAYLLIVDAYINSGQYLLALRTLETMNTKDYLVHYKALARYKVAYCHEMLGDSKLAIDEYKSVIVHFPYTEYSFLSEKRLYDLTVATAGRIDYSNLLPSESQYADRTYVDTTHPDTDEEFYYIQVSAFANRENAETYSQHLKQQQFSNIVFSKPVGAQTFHVVAVGPFRDRDDARAKQQDIKRNLNVDSFIIRH